MSLITRFNGAFKAFASEATGTFRTVFGGTTQSNDLTDNITNDFKTGWEIVGTNDEPTIEDFNAMGYTLSQVLAYIHQVGIIEWNGTDVVVGGQDYYANKSYVGYGGDIYVAILDSGGSIEARIPTNATYWKKVSSATLDINGLTNKATPIDTDNMIIQETGGLLKKLSWANLKATLKTYFDTLYASITGTLTTASYLHIQDQKPSGTSGGSSSAGTNTRVLNTVVTNTIAGASLASNQITLPAGTYKIKISTPIHNAAQNKAYLYNVTDSNIQILGTSEYSAAASSVQVSSIIIGLFLISGTKTFDVRHYATNAQPTNGLGVATGIGSVEIYTDVEIWKVG